MGEFMEVFADAALDACIDTAKMLPFLFVIYVLIEILKAKFGHKLGPAMERAGKAGPAIGAVAGIIPQCGISVVGTALYTQRLVTIGTLFAVYIATSDEAIPIILSQPEAVGVLLPLIISKLLIAIVVGYALDFVLQRRNRTMLENRGVLAGSKSMVPLDGVMEDALREEAFTRAAQITYADDPSVQNESTLYECACGCTANGAQEPATRRLTARNMLWYPLIHTLQVAGFILVISFLLALLFELVGQETIAHALEGHLFLQPVLAALIGLIPNCAASVVVTELYLDGVISFGATVAGLCAGGGLGVLVLLEEDTNRKEALTIIGGLFIISVLAGLLIQALSVTV